MVPGCERPGGFRLHGHLQHQEAPNPGPNPGECLDKRQKVIFPGNSGTGKTQLAIAPGRDSCQQGTGCASTRLRAGERAHGCPDAACPGQAREAVAATRSGDHRRAWLHPVEQTGGGALFQFLSLGYERGACLSPPTSTPTAGQRSSGTRS